VLPAMIDNAIRFLLERPFTTPNADR